MAHFLSDVTHMRLELRTDDESTVTQKNITHTHDFTGQIRCLEVVPSLNTTLEVWSGDVDGSLTMRRGIDGKPFRTIEPVSSNIFVFALQFMSPYVWAGRSDGFLQCFHSQTFEKVFEAKAHSGPINCLCACGGYIFSGGSDWQIHGWDNNSGKRIGQLTGHTNSVRCFCANGPLLYSGSDDGSIWCWNVEGLLPRSQLWPIRASTEGSVKAIDVSEVYLFSGASDGCLKVWNTQTAQLVRTIDQRHSAINSIFVAPTTDRLWAACADGSISIWNIETLSKETILCDHRATTVPLIRTVARVNSVKLWTLSAEGEVRVWYSDTDPGSNEFEVLAKMETELQSHVAEYRNRVVHNYYQLERCKEDLVILETNNTSKKLRLGHASGNSSQRLRILRGLLRTRGWVCREYEKQTSRRVASFVERNSKATQCQPFFWKWVQFAKHRRVSKMNARMEQLITNISHRDLTLRLLWRLAHIAQSQFLKDQAATLALISFSHSNNRIAAAFFQKWKTMLAISSMKRLHINFKKMCEGYLLRQRCSAAWALITRGHSLVQGRFTVLSLANALQSSTISTMCQKVMFQWTKYVATRKKQKEVAAATRIIFNASQTSLLATYFRRWSHRSLTRDLNLQSSRTIEANENVRKRQRIVDSSSGCSESQLEEELQKKQITLAKILEEQNDLDEVESVLLSQKRELQRELLRSSVLAHEAHAPERLHQSVNFLKARGVNAFHDVESIDKIRSDFRKVGALETIHQGIVSVRKVLSKLCRPQTMKERGDPEWFVGDTFAKIKRKSVLKAGEGLCQIVVGFDGCEFKELEKWSQSGSWDDSHAFLSEVSANIGPLLEIAVRAYRYRRGEDPRTGESIEKKSMRTPKKSFLPKKPLKKKRLVKRTRCAPSTARESPATENENDATSFIRTEAF